MKSDNLIIQYNSDKQVMMDRDPDYYTIKDHCQQFVGKEFGLSVSFDSEILSLEDCDGLNNAIGSILEQTIFLVLKKVLPQFTRGPKQKSPDYFNRDKYEYELECFETTAGFDISAYNAYIEQLAHENGIHRKIVDTKYSSIV
jgi:hypothetical protein